MDATSVLELLTLGAGPGTELILSAKGRHSEEVLEVLARLFAVEFAVDYKG